MTGGSELGYKVVLNTSYEEAVRRVVEALKAQGFGVLTEIDVKATLKQKLDVDYRRYVILGACNPPLAYRALQTDPDIGLLLPCNVTVYENADGSGVTVALANPMAMMQFSGNPALEAVAAEANGKLQAVAEALRA
ncbi:MAG: DUF302 domain-containing protein [Anaerolineae bacterium]